MIRERIQEGIEKQVCKTQYGFRPKRSTSHAIYLIRRIQDYGEIKGAPLCMALLDWEKAFDKIIHDRMFDALRRLNIDEHIITVIRNCYKKKPKFFVRDEYGK